ncbi:Phr family secreted Rap phosphatase inhibitor [Bacillus cereus]|uniref:Phr family secreted Rap phosphatase inhibitor n=1 Tax=Bacillus cereus TaxID=1396 RepID=A0A9X7CNT8_BACCE|nr:Phr family secreted Rap phosphatase inhibitor [Bacillus cereus]PGS79363.1 Phr family secreted Rap phosphatase inhibitor [Bacillus cereus]
MKKLTEILTGLTLSTMLSLGLTFPSQSEQTTHSDLSKTSPIITQYSHADTW